MLDYFQELSIFMNNFLSLILLTVIIFSLKVSREEYDPTTGQSLRIMNKGMWSISLSIVIGIVLFNLLSLVIHLYLHHVMI